MNYEEEIEMEPFTSEMETAMRQVFLDRAPSELAQLSEAKGDAETFTHLPTAAAVSYTHLFN